MLAHKCICICIATPAEEDPVGSTRNKVTQDRTRRKRRFVGLTPCSAKPLTFNGLASPSPMELILSGFFRWENQHVSGVRMRNTTPPRRFPTSLLRRQWGDRPFRWDDERRRHFCLTVSPEARADSTRSGLERGWSESNCTQYKTEKAPGLRFNPLTARLVRVVP